jgi:hypothetical protein
MLPHCRSFLAGKSGSYEGVCMGSITAIAFVSLHLSDERRFCFPKGVTDRQLVRVVVAYTEARPERMHEDWRLLAGSL